LAQDGRRSSVSIATGLIHMKTDKAMRWIESGGVEQFLRLPRFEEDGAIAMLINPKGKLLAVLDHAEEYRLLAIRSRIASSATL
jgi:hypothetical protein